MSPAISSFTPPVNSLGFGGYIKIAITPEQRLNLTDPLTNGVILDGLQELVEGYEKLDSPEPYLPNSDEDSLYVFHNDSEREHSTQWNQIKYEGYDARRNFIANLDVNA